MPTPLPPNNDAAKARNRSHNLRNAAKVERYLMELEKSHGFTRSWELRERLERGDVTLDELGRR